MARQVGEFEKSLRETRKPVLANSIIIEWTFDAEALQLHPRVAESRVSKKRSSYFAILHPASCGFIFLNTHV